MITDKELDDAIFAYQNGLLSVFDLVSKCQMRDLHTQNLMNQALALPESVRLKIGLDDMFVFSAPVDITVPEGDELEDEKPKKKSKESLKTPMDQYLERLYTVVGIRRPDLANLKVTFDPTDSKMVIFKSEWMNSNQLEAWFQSKGLKFETCPLNADRRRICITIYELKKVKLVPPQVKVIDSGYANIVASKIYLDEDGDEAELFGRLSVVEWELVHEFTFSDGRDFSAFKDYLKAVRVMPQRIQDFTVAVRTASLRRLNLLPK